MQLATRELAAKIRNRMAQLGYVCDRAGRIFYRQINETTRLTVTLQLVREGTGWRLVPNLAIENLEISRVIQELLERRGSKKGTFLTISLGLVYFEDGVSANAFTFDTGEEFEDAWHLFDLLHSKHASSFAEKFASTKAISTFLQENSHYRYMIVANFVLPVAAFLCDQLDVARAAVMRFQAQLEKEGASEVGDERILFAKNMRARLGGNLTMLAKLQKENGV